MKTYQVGQKVITIWGMGIITKIITDSATNHKVYYVWSIDELINIYFGKFKTIIPISKIPHIDSRVMEFHVDENTLRPITIWDKVKRFFGIKYKF